jgi:uncharacterized protein (DUF2147 family)
LGCDVSKAPNQCVAVEVVVNMKRLSLLTLLLVLSSQPLWAADPSGDWLVEDGSAKIRVAICGGSLWGVVGWEKSPGKDTANPDPAKRSRDTLGMPILIDMKPSGADKWAGQIYNAKDGKMYQASVTLESERALKVRGCVLGGLFCGGETWARSVDPEPDAGKAKPKGKPASKDTVGSGLAGSICSRLSSLTGTTH